MTARPDPTFFRDAALEAPRTLDFAGGELVLFTTPAPEPGRRNEDGIAVIPLGDDCGVIAIADGAGGMQGGALASGTALEAFAAAIHDSARNEQSLREGILGGFDRANQAVTNLRGAGTTLVAIRIAGRELRTYHVGDSRALVTGGGGLIKLLTIDHSPVAYAVEAGVVDRKDAIFHEDRHLVSNLLGSADMRIEVGAPLSLAARDTLVMASDGLHDNLRTSEIVALVRKGKLVIAADELIALCKRRMAEEDAGAPSKPDDLTFVLFRAARP